MFGQQKKTFGPMGKVLKTPLVKKSQVLFFSKNPPLECNVKISGRSNKKQGAHSYSKVSLLDLVPILVQIGRSKKTTNTKLLL
jgi:hypothetical protein